MSVDKFGHFSNSETLRRNVPKILGIAVDRYYNLNIQNKKIKNLAPPSEDTDAVNKVYLQTQISHSREILKNEMTIEFQDIREQISQLKHNLQDVFEVMSKMSIPTTLIYNNQR